MAAKKITYAKRTQLAIMSLAAIMIGETGDATNDRETYQLFSLIQQTLNMYLKFNTNNLINLIDRL